MVDDHQDIPHLLGALDGVQRRIERGLARRMRAGAPTLRGSEGRILDLIGPDGTRPSVLADGAWISKQAIGKRIREMETRGLVTVEPDPDDRRAVIVRRAPEGKRLQMFTLQQIADLESELAGIVGVDRYSQFRDVLDELAASETDRATNGRFTDQSGRCRTRGVGFRG